MSPRDPHIDPLVASIGEELADTLFAAQTQARPLTRIAACDEAEAARRASLGRGWLDALARLDRTGLADDDRLNLAIAETTARRLASAHDWFWHVHDPLGMGFFGRFGPTAYAGGWHWSVIGAEIGRQALSTPEDRERFALLAEDIVGVVRAMTVRLTGQRARGIVLPGAATDNAVRLVASGGERLIGQLRVAAAAAVSGYDILIERLIETDLRPALAALAAATAYAGVPHEGSALGATAAGAAIYEALVGHYTSLPLDAEAVHARGTEKMAAIRDAMAALRGASGFAGDDAGYAAAIAADPDWRAGSDAMIAERFGACLSRARDHRETWFHAVPKAGSEAAPLPAALEGSMTFGYYQIASPDGAPARYLFNATTLRAIGLARVAAFAYHELEPGHHIHLAGQAEDDTLPPLRRYNSFNAFNEGWAEYAAALAGEHGLYAKPEERFGRLMLEAMLTSRLVVDTGLNARGWSLDRAQAYLIEWGFLPPAEARSEVLRYAYDLPGQALAYKLGDEFLIAERERMRRALGPRFDLRDFHALVLRPGARPLPLIADAVDRAIAA